MLFGDARKCAHQLAFFTGASAAGAGAASASAPRTGGFGVFGCTVATGAFDVVAVVASAGSVAFAGDAMVFTGAGAAPSGAGVPNICTTNVVVWPSYFPTAVAMPISVKWPFRRFARWVGEFIHAVSTSFESVKLTARFSPA